MGRLFLVEVDEDKVFRCKCCNVDFVSKANIVSREFQGRYGRAYLCRNVVNVIFGASEERNLSSGLHVVNDIYCTSCHEILGWKYEKAEEDSQKYKEGMFILEKERMLKYGW
ncbi:Putative yippee-like protein Os10g0369500 [Linum grandiflorum]